MAATSASALVADAADASGERSALRASASVSQRSALARALPSAKPSQSVSVREEAAARPAEMSAGATRWERHLWLRVLVAFGTPVLLSLVYVLVPLAAPNDPAHASFWVYSFALMEMRELYSFFCNSAVFSFAQPGLPFVLHVLSLVLCVFANAAFAFAIAARDWEAQPIDLVYPPNVSLVPIITLHLVHCLLAADAEWRLRPRSQRVVEPASASVEARQRALAAHASTGSSATAGSADVPRRGGAPGGSRHLNLASSPSDGDNRSEYSGAGLTGTASGQSALAWRDGMYDDLDYTQALRDADADAARADAGAADLHAPESERGALYGESRAASATSSAVAGRTAPIDIEQRALPAVVVVSVPDSPFAVGSLGSSLNEPTVEGEYGIVFAPEARRWDITARALKRQRDRRERLQRRRDALERRVAALQRASYQASADSALGALPARRVADALARHAGTDEVEARGLLPLDGAEPVADEAESAHDPDVDAEDDESVALRRLSTGSMWRSPAAHYGATDATQFRSDERGARPMAQEGADAMLHMTCRERATAVLSVAWYDDAFRAFSVHRRPLLQFFLSFLFMGMIVALFMTCVQFSDLMADTNFTDLTRMGFFCAFLAVTQVFKAVLKNLGFAIDMGKHGGSCFFFMGELISQAFFFLFYRLLFASVDSWALFGVVEALHIATEWLSYCVRATAFYFNVSVRVSSALTRWMPSRLRQLLLQTDMEPRQWAAFLCLDFGVRFFVMIALSVSFVANFLVLRFSYNAPYYSFFATMAPDDFERLMYMMVVALVLEVLSFVIMELAFWRRMQLSLLQRVGALLSNRMYVVYTISVLAAILANAYVTRTRINLLRP